jgi:hypothetical protein
LARQTRHGGFQVAFGAQYSLTSHSSSSRLVQSTHPDSLGGWNRQQRDPVEDRGIQLPWHGHVGQLERDVLTQLFALEAFEQPGGRQQLCRRSKEHSEARRAEEQRVLPQTYGPGSEVRVRPRRGEQRWRRFHQGQGGCTRLVLVETPPTHSRVRTADCPQYPIAAIQLYAMPACCTAQSADGAAGPVAGCGRRPRSLSRTGVLFWAFQRC